MKKIIPVFIVLISVIAVLFFNNSNIKLKSRESATTTTQPDFLPPGYDLEKILLNSKTLGNFFIHSDGFFNIQDSQFIKFTENSKEDIIYSIGISASEYIDTFIEDNKDAPAENCAEIPDITAFHFESSFCNKTGTTKAVFCSDGYIYISNGTVTSRFNIGTEEYKAFSEGFLKSGVSIWTPENPVTIG